MSVLRFNFDQDQRHLISTKFKGFIPSPQEELKIKNKLENLLEVAPANAFIFAKVKKQNDKFTMSISLNSIPLQFKISKSADSIQNLLVDISNCFLLKITHWKAMRFRKEVAY